MKYWNKDKKIRTQCWHSVPAPSASRQQEAKRWCQQHSSPGKFYFYFAGSFWWFENEEDAFVFSMAW